MTMPATELLSADSTGAPYVSGNFAPLLNEDDVWYVAQVIFPTNGGAPTATALPQTITNVPSPDFTQSGPGVCP